MKPLAALRYLRLARFDTTTEQGRRDERYRLAAVAIVANVLSRAVGLATMLLSVNLTLPYLGVERFGVWMTVASFAGLLTFLDLGVGNALTNHVAHRAAAAQPGLLTQAVSGGLACLALIGTAVAVVLLFVAAVVPWDVLVKVNHPDLLVETRQAAMCFAVLFGVNIFANGVQRVFAGLQQAYLGHLANALGSLAACAGLWFAAKAHQGIPVLLTMLLGLQSLTCLPLLILLFFRGQFRLAGLAAAVRSENRHLFKTGGLFFILQIGTMVGWGADNLIIASTLGVAQVAIFSVVQRLFQLATQPIGIMNAPLWGAYADADARNDHMFIRKTLGRSMTLTLASATLAVAVLLAMHTWLIERWTHATIVAPMVFIAVYAVWVIMDACGNAFAMFLNGTGIVKQQITVVLLFVALVLPLKLMLVERLGLLALPMATIAAYLVSTVGVYGIVFLPTIRGKSR